MTEMKRHLQISPLASAKSIALPCLLIPMLHLAGCVLNEPYPALTMEDVQQRDVPTRILKDFEREQHGSIITRIEKRVLHSRNAGYPTWYRFTFASPDGQTGRVILDNRGRPFGGQDALFPEENSQTPPP
jgi:hypothetical protein